MKKLHKPKKLSFLKKILLGLTGLVLVSLAISGYFLARYGVGPLTYLTIPKPTTINCVGDCWYLENKVSDVVMVDKKTGTTVSNKDYQASLKSGKKPEVIYKWIETDRKTSEVTQVTETDKNNVQKVKNNSDGTTTVETIKVKGNTPGKNNGDRETTVTTYDAKGRVITPPVTTKTKVSETPGQVPPKSGSGGTDPTIGLMDPTIPYVPPAAVVPPVPPIIPPGAPNCNAGMCKTNGSPVCSGAYVFTGGSTSGVKDGTYACAKCDPGNKKGPYADSGYDCGKLIDQGAPVVMMYDADSKWLAKHNLPTSGSGPCFEDIGGWIQAAIGQQKSDGSAYCGAGGWQKDKPITVTPPGSGDGTQPPLSGLEQLTIECRKQNKAVKKNSLNECGALKCGSGWQLQADGSCKQPSSAKGVALANSIKQCEDKTRGGTFDMSTGLCVTGGVTALSAAGKAAYAATAACKDGLQNNNAMKVTCSPEKGGAVYEFCSTGTNGKFNDDGSCPSSPSSANPAAPAQPDANFDNAGSTVQLPAAPATNTPPKTSGTITAGEKCAGNDDNNSCESGDCRFISKSGDKNSIGNRNWYCMPSSTLDNRTFWYFSSSATIWNQLFGKKLAKGQQCFGRDSSCQTNYCADVVGFDTCEDNPFVNTNPIPPSEIILTESQKQNLHDTTREWASNNPIDVKDKKDCPKESRIEENYSASNLSKVYKCFPK